MNSFQQQIEHARQQIAQTGFGGTAIIDVHPSEGFLRLKVRVNSPEKLAEFMTNYANILAMTLAMTNVQAKIHVARDTK